MSTYKKTMERLRRLSAGRPVSDKLAVEMLSLEIDSYRNQVEIMRKEIPCRTGASMKQLTKASIGLAAAARDFTNTMGELAAAVVDAMNCIDWKALSEALAAVGYGSQEAEPDDNPVRFIGIRKRGWKRGRRKYRC